MKIFFFIARIKTFIFFSDDTKIDHRHKVRSTLLNDLLRWFKCNIKISQILQQSALTVH